MARPTDPIAELSLEGQAIVGRPALLRIGESHDPNGFIVSAKLDPGDGCTVIAITGPLPPTVAHIYQRPGQYTATLVVTDNSKRNGSTSRAVHVQVASVEEPPVEEPEEPEEPPVEEPPTEPEDPPVEPPPVEEPPVEPEEPPVEPPVEPEPEPEPQPEPTPEPEPEPPPVIPPPPVSSETHAYYDALTPRPDTAASYSLRSQAQIDQYRRSKDKPLAVTYDPANDTDARRQDAAKIVIPPSTNSLPTQLWLPMRHQPRTSLLVTWDAWLGAEFRTAGIPTYKAFQLGSPNESIWTEPQYRFSMAPTGFVAMSAIRQYGSGQQGPNVTYGPVLNGRNYGGNVIGPMVNEFGIAPETWTRYWVLLEPQSDGLWYRLSMWMADVDRDAVQVYDGLQVRPNGGMDGVWGTFRIEYNTSTSTLKAGRGELTSYVRNVVMLRGTRRASVDGLLQRPVD